MFSVKTLLWLGLLAPAGWLGYQVWALTVSSAPSIGALGADPAEYIVRFLGEWGLRVLLLSLAISSFARRLRKPALIRLRRLVGLFAFAYLSAHFAGYVWLLAEARWSEILADFFERPYISAGLVGWVMLLPLAVTSTRGWQRRLGRRWRLLHRLVYPALLAGLIHLFWLTKDGFGEVALYALLGIALLAERRFKPAR